MRVSFVCSLVLAFIGLDVASAQPPGRGRMGDQEAARHGWLSSLEEGKSQARKNGKPLMVVIRCVP